jgi:hypothetical protein
MSSHYILTFSVRLRSNLSDEDMAGLDYGSLEDLYVHLYAPGLKIDSVHEDAICLADVICNP